MTVIVPSDKVRTLEEPLVQALPLTLQGARELKQMISKFTQILKLHLVSL